MHYHNAPGSLYYLQHLRSCAAYNAQGSTILHGSAGKPGGLFPNYGLGLEGLIVFILFCNLCQMLSKFILILRSTDFIIL